MGSLLWRAFSRPLTPKAGGPRLVRCLNIIREAGRHPSSISPITLRDACKCSRCVDQSTMQRDFLFSDIPTNIEATAEKVSDTQWIIKWQNDIPGYEDHVSTFDQSQLDNIVKPPVSDYRPVTMLWDASTFERETTPVKYGDFINSTAGLAKALWLLRRHGLLFLTEVPSEPESVSRIAQRIAPLRNTFYGDTWNVKSVPQAKNVAYTSKYLGFHMDLLYMEESPGVQFLHCLENTSTGGESRFVDTFKAFDVLLEENKDQAKQLKNTFIRYEYDNDGHYYTNVKPVVQTLHHHNIPRPFIQGAANPSDVKYVSRIYWSPPFVGTIQNTPNMDREGIAKRVAATKSFADILERKELVYETKMNAGTCVIFDNLRVVHARNAFDMNSGERWLRGCYLDSQDVTSRELSLKDEILKLQAKV